MIQNTIFKPIWSIFFASSLTFGTYLAIETLVRFDNKQSFIGFSVVLLAMFLLEIFITWQYNVSLRKETLEAEIIEYELIHIAHKIILPITLYISIIAFSYYNFATAYLLYLLVGVFLINVFLFQNIRAYFEHRNLDEIQTHIVFDIIKFFIFFTSVNAFLHNIVNHEERSVVLTIIITTLTFVLILLMTWRMTNKHVYATELTLVGSLTIGMLFAVLSRSMFYNVMQNTLILTVMFYVYVGFIHHLIEKTLSRNLMLEYFLIVVIIAGVFAGVR